MTYIPPVQTPPQGINPLFENQVKADAFGNLAGIIGNAIGAHKASKLKKKAETRANRLVSQLSLNADERFAPHRQSIVEAMVEDPVKGASIVNDLRQMFLMDDTKNAVANLRIDMEKEKLTQKAEKDKHSMKEMTDATKKVFNKPMTKEEALMAMSAYQASAEHIGASLQLVEAGEESGLSGMVHRNVSGGSDGKLYSIKVSYNGPRMPQDESLDPEEGSGDEDAQMRLLIKRTLSGQQ